MRLIIYGLSVVALLMVGAVVGPSFVDWNKFKPQIISQIQNATGLKVSIDGDLGLGVLPTPHVKVSDITIASPKKLEFENILVMKSANISVEIMPLFQKQVKINSVKLIEPNIQIEMMTDGTPSWTIEKTVQAKEVVEAPAEQVLEPASATKNNALDSISLESLEIENGKFVYIDHRTKARHSAQDVNLILKADSLKGPFDLDGSLKIDGKKVVLDGQTGKLPSSDEPLTVQAEISLPEANSSVSFNGVASTKQPYDAQGKAKLDVQSPDKLAQLLGVQSTFHQSVSLDGLLTANQHKVQYDDLKFALGNFVGSGKFSIENINTENPLNLKGNIKSGSVLDIDSLMPKSSAKKSEEKTSNDDLQNAGKIKSSSKAIIPQTLTLPMAVNTDIQLDVGGIKFQNQNVKGVFLDLNKEGATTKASFKTLELPGQAKADGTLTVTYASTSKASKTKQITYSDPNVSYDINGQIGQLATFLKAFAPDANTGTVTKLYKTAQFDLKGKVNGNSISLSDSTLKLDEMVVGLGGRYEPATSSKRAKATIDISAGTVDFDKIKQAQGGQKTESSGSSSSGGKSSSSPKEALKPIQGFSLPLDLGFDISLQKHALIMRIWRGYV
ncbi:MAG: AsmA family protein [Alphaproteobacteria bacterium]